MLLLLAWLACISAGGMLRYILCCSDVGTTISHAQPCGDLVGPALLFQRIQLIHALVPLSMYHHPLDVALRCAVILGYPSLLAQLLDGCISLQRWQLPSAITYANKMRHIRISRRIRCAIISAAISHRANTAIRGCQHLLPWLAHRAIFHADGCCCASCSTPLWLAAIFGPKQTISAVMGRSSWHPRSGHPRADIWHIRC